MAQLLPYADGERVEIAGSPVRFRTSSRARRVSLRIDAIKREVIATAPNLRRLADAAAFAKERGPWMARELARLPKAQDVSPLTQLNVFDLPLVIERAGLHAAIIPASDDAAGRLILPADAARAPAALTRLLRRHALVTLTARTEIYSARVGRPAPKVVITDARTRWGSCKGATATTPAVIRYSWRLALAPFIVADYVVAHECAHLIEANHGPRFWTLVKTLCGDPAPHRAWLRAHGNTLHAFGR